MAFGGAGPLHAAPLARDLGIERVLIPPAPGILCALGLLVAPLRLDLVRTRVALLDTLTAAELAQGFEDLSSKRPSGSTRKAWRRTSGDWRGRSTCATSARTSS